MTEDLSPVRQQYLQIKRQHPDAIVFFRLGDFYETFDQDAEVTSRELDIVLTSRNVAKGVRVPMAGIPYHAVETYLARLIEKGLPRRHLRTGGRDARRAGCSRARSCAWSPRGPWSNPGCSPAMPTTTWRPS